MLRDQTRIEIKLRLVDLDFDLDPDVRVLEVPEQLAMVVIPSW